jgi:hypothetical protein
MPSLTKSLAFVSSQKSLTNKFDNFRKFNIRLDLRKYKMLKDYTKLVPQYLKLALTFNK